MLNYRAASCFSRTAKIGSVFEVIDGLTGNVIESGMSYMLPGKVCGDVIQSEGVKWKIEERKKR